MITKTDKETFEGMFAEWSIKWDKYLKERTIDAETGKSYYTHKKLRSAYLSIKRNLPLLFTWYDNIEMKIPNTTNLIDGHFSQLKRMLRSHNGLKRERDIISSLLGFLRHQRELPNNKKAVAADSLFIGTKPYRLFLEELLPSRAPFRFIDSTKVRLFIQIAKFL